MRLAALSFLLVGYFLSPASGWGYLYSRFRPESTGWGYGGASLPNPPAQRISPREQLMHTLMEEGLLEEESCDGRRCTSNDYCCSGHICVGYDTSTSGGTCMATSSHRRLLECSSDFECNEGYVCELGECTPSNDKKGYSDPCLGSAECNSDKGLCCQIVRRHRQAPRKLCMYYKNPMSCIGNVEDQPVKRSRISE